MTSISEFINHLENNPILPTIASGGIAVWLISNIKSIFYTVVDLVTNLISFTIYNNYTDERGFGHGMYQKQISFDKIVSESKPIWERTTNIDLNSGILSDAVINNDVIDMPPENRKTENNGSVRIKTYGFSIRILLGSLVFVERSINKNQKITVDTSIRVFFSRKSKFLERLDKEITKVTLEDINNGTFKDTVRVFYGSQYYNCFIRKNKRNIDSIFLDGDGHVELLEDIRKFISNKETYQKMNYPYKYSALVHGVPGSGKTSTILAIATELGRDVEYVNISEISSKELIDRLNSFPKRIFVFEDIDAIGYSANSNRGDSGEDNDSSGKESGENPKENDFEDLIGGKVSLSDLLNITDGLLSSDGVICIFTTNHRDRLDPAFLRAGRMNKTIEFGYMSGNTANRMTRYHLGIDINGFSDGIKPAELQECILDVKTGRKTIEDLKKEFCS